MSPSSQTSIDVVVVLTVEEARALWLAYKGPVGENASEHLQSAEDKLCRALKIEE